MSYLLQVEVEIDHGRVISNERFGLPRKVGGSFLAIIHPLLAILASVVFLSGCAGGPPSENVARGIIERQIQTQSNGKIKLLSFTKTNGKQQDDYYQLEYKAEIEFLANGAWSRAHAMDPSPSFEFSNQQLPANALAQFTGAVFGSSNVRQGQREQVNGVLRFEKTEKGWRAHDGKSY